jgi:hypothetical protein
MVILLKDNPKNNNPNPLIAPTYLGIICKDFEKPLSTSD